MNLFEKIQTLCKGKNTTIAALERTLGFGNGTIKKWVTTIPSGDRLAKVADYFNVTVDYLLGRTELESIKTLAAHRDGDEKWTNDELDKIEEYKQLLIAARNNKR